MDFDVAVKDHDFYMRVAVAGRPSLGQLLSLVHILGVESASWRHECLLVDLRGVATEFSRPEQARIGEEAASSLAHVRRIASLVPPERLTRVSERVAQRSGANVCVFDTEAAALDWLRGD